MANKEVNLVKRMMLDKYGVTLTDDVLLQNIKEYLLSFGCDETFQHTLDVVDKVVTLSNQFEFDVDKCVVAAYLHDIGRVIDKNDLVQFCKAFGHPVLKGEMAAPGLLHQIASKIIAVEIFGIKDFEILDALACHTTLKQYPTQTDMVVFIADKLSWREDSYQTLVEGVKDALTVSIENAILYYFEDMHSRREELTYYHKWSQEAYGYFKGMLQGR